MKRNYVLFLALASIFIWLAYLTFSDRQLKLSGESTNYTMNEVVGFSTDLTKLAAETQSGVVSVESGSHLSTGFFYREVDGKSYFLTTYHGLTEGPILLHFANGYQTAATLKAHEIYADIALLEVKLPYSLQATTFGASDQLQKGEFLLTLGTPLSLDYQGSVSFGMLSNAPRDILNDIQMDGKKHRYFIHVGQLNAALTEGYSGGPLYNLAKQLVGMNLFSAGEGVTFFLPAEEIKVFAEKALQSEKVSKTNFGLSLRDLRQMPNYLKASLAIPLTCNEGYYVQEVMPNSLSALAGIRAGDVLLRINDHSLNSYHDFLTVSYEEKENYVFHISRGEQSQRLEASLVREP